jgi:hypothetical protein
MIVRTIGQSNEKILLKKLFHKKYLLLISTKIAANP